jgi:ribose/xylose/arabinose/galactoside ABC-type transport system permease subunit
MVDLPDGQDLRRMVRELESALGRSTDDALAWLASPQGRRLRALAARGLVLAAPVLLRHPVFSRTPAGRLLRLVGTTAAVAKLAEVIRDWEPVPLRART